MINKLLKITIFDTANVVLIYGHLISRQCEQQNKWRPLTRKKMPQNRFMKQDNEMKLTNKDSTLLKLLQKMTTFISFFWLFSPCDTCHSSLLSKCQISSGEKKKKVKWVWSIFIFLWIWAYAYVHHSLGNRLKAICQNILHSI